MFDTDVVVMDQPSLLSGVGIAAAGTGAILATAPKQGAPLVPYLHWGTP